MGRKWPFPDLGQNPQPDLLHQDHCGLANSNDKNLPDYRYTGNTWSGGYAGVYHLAPANFLGKYIDAGQNFAHGDDVSMPATAQSRISSAANFSNSEISIPHVGSLSTLNKNNYTISFWTKLKGDVVELTNGLLEHVYNGSFSNTDLNPIDSGNGLLTTNRTPVATLFLDTNTNLYYAGAQANARSNNVTGTDTFAFAWEGYLNVGGNSPISAGDISFSDT